MELLQREVAAVIKTQQTKQKDKSSGGFNQFEDEGSSGGNQRRYRPYNKIDFPTFSEGDHRGWILKAEKYFRYYNVLEEERVDVAAMHLEGDARISTHGSLPIKILSTGKTWFVLSRITSVLLSSKTSMNICVASNKQVQYKSTDKSSPNCPHTNWLEHCLLGLFLNGLKDDLKADVRIHKPRTVYKAMSIAIEFESKVVHTKFGKSLPSLAKIESVPSKPTETFSLLSSTATAKKPTEGHLSDVEKQGSHLTAEIVDLDNAGPAAQFPLTRLEDKSSLGAGCIDTNRVHAGLGQVRYNGHVLDKDYRFQMTTGGYYRLALNIKGLARIVCGGRCVFFLDGGYHVTSLAESVVESFRAFVDDPSMAPNYSFLLDYEPSDEPYRVFISLSKNITGHEGRIVHLLLIVNRLANSIMGRCAPEALGPCAFGLVFDTVLGFPEPFARRGGDTEFLRLFTATIRSVNSMFETEDGSFKKFCELRMAGTLVRLAKQKPIRKVVYCAVPALSHDHEDPEENRDQECSDRVTYILSGLKKAKLTPKFRESEIIQLKNIRSATMEEIQSVHSRSYVLSLMQSIEESMAAVGAGLSVVDSVVEASKLNDIPPIGFALIRPPGSHAVPNAELPMGFCVFNNVAIAARYAQRVHGLKRIFIIDFDVNHGKGICDAFYDDPDVFYLSTHQDIAYTHHRGKIGDIGCDNGEGTTLNVPLPKLTGDVAMLNVFDEVIIPATKKFKPDIILVSAGYNGHVCDYGSKFQMTTGGYYRIASKIQGLAQILCGGRCVFFLEGGNKIFLLADCVVESFRAFLGDPSMATDYGGDLDYEPSSKVKQVIKRIKHLHSL
ncbi:histone deacetylase 14 [Artemisia annua]|uniref:Histone deacetylase 14 n=1 Tax=Artemisia annua TaxID=35608 RepID=A0A2U1M9A2_ARTAN|nr:histone deacetylase 14 [Artemisia annua]